MGINVIKFTRSVSEPASSENREPETYSTCKALPFEAAISDLQGIITSLQEATVTDERLRKSRRSCEWTRLVYLKKHTKALADNQLNAQERQMRTQDEPINAPDRSVHELLDHIRKIAI